MIEGMKVLFYRMVYGVFVIIALMPVWHLVFAYVNGEIEAHSWTQFVDGINYIQLGVDMIPFIIMASIGIAVFHIYYRAVSQRKYESQYSQEAMFYNGYRKP